jgi:hypothetical protein
MQPRSEQTCGGQRRRHPDHHSGRDQHQSAYTRRRGAKAMRTPISRVRRPTVYAMTPYNPTAPCTSLVSSPADTCNCAVESWTIRSFRTVDPRRRASYKGHEKESVPGLLAPRAIPPRTRGPTAPHRAQQFYSSRIVPVSWQRAYPNVGRKSTITSHPFPPCGGVGPESAVRSTPSTLRTENRPA